MRPLHGVQSQARFGLRSLPSLPLVPGENRPADVEIKYRG